jgi:hypothetical protein
MYRYYCCIISAFFLGCFGSILFTYFHFSTTIFSSHTINPLACWIISIQFKAMLFSYLIIPIYLLLLYGFKYLVEYDNNNNNNNMGLFHDLIWSIKATLVSKLYTALLLSFYTKNTNNNNNNNSDIESNTSIHTGRVYATLLVLLPSLISLGILLKYHYTIQS